jgi:hypothetical protein
LCGSCAETHDLWEEALCRTKERSKASNKSFLMCVFVVNFLSMPV